MIEKKTILPVYRARPEHLPQFWCSTPKHKYVLIRIITVYILVVVSLISSKQILQCKCFRFKRTPWTDQITLFPLKVRIVIWVTIRTMGPANINNSHNAGWIYTVGSYLWYILGLQHLQKLELRLTCIGAIPSYFYIRARRNLSYHLI